MNSLFLDELALASLLAIATLRSTSLSNDLITRQLHLVQILAGH